MHNLILTPISVESLTEKIALKTVEILEQKHNQKIIEPEADNPLGIKEASKLIGKTVPTLYGYCQRNEMPYHKNGNRLIFFKSELIDWIKQGKQKTLKELEAETDTYLSNKNKGV